MIISKTFSGLNMNALKYLLPLWMSPLSGVAIRCTFAAVAFWIIACFTKPEKSTLKEKGLLFLLGATGIYGFMFFYLVGLSKTTPVSSSIFTTLQPIWVFIIAVLFFREKITVMKVVGILIGLGGALLCISTQKSDDLASDALTGNMLCLTSSVIYAVYLVLSNRLLKSVGMYTLLKYTFTGAAFSSIIVTLFTGFNAPVLSFPLHWFPFLVLLFVLIFPTVISYLLIPVGLKYLSTTVVAIYGYLILIVATIASLAIGQDRFSWAQMSAILMICAGVYFVEIAEKKDNKPSFSEKE
nr:DMT family transporter [Coprobacter tertius]